MFSHLYLLHIPCAGVDSVGFGCVDHQMLSVLAQECTTTSIALWYLAKCYSIVAHYINYRSTNKVVFTSWADVHLAACCSYMSFVYRHSVFTCRLLIPIAIFHWCLIS